MGHLVKITFVKYRKKKKQHHSPQFILNHFPILSSTCLIAGHPYYFSPRRASFVSPLPQFEFVTRFSYTRFHDRQFPFHGPLSISTIDSSANSSSKRSTDSQATEIISYKSSSLATIIESVEEGEVDLQENPIVTSASASAIAIASNSTRTSTSTNTSTRTSTNQFSSSNSNRTSSATINSSNIESNNETSSQSSIHSTMTRVKYRKFRHLHAARKLFSPLQSDQQIEELGNSMNSLTLED